MTILPDDVVKVLLAVLIGALIGAEREFRDKAAGLLCGKAFHPYCSISAL